MFESCELNMLSKKVCIDLGRLLLLSKDANSVMFERLAQDERVFEVQTRLHINENADAGLKTLVFVY